MGWPSGPVVARRGALPVLALALGVLTPGRGAALERSLPAPDAVRLAQAYTAAWNAHDLPAVLALFAPDAVVRERRRPVPPDVWDTRDPEVVRAYLDELSLTATYDRDDFRWVAGQPQIAAWAAAQFRLGHRFVAGPYRAAGDTVGWPYREFVDPFQRLPGVSPLEGDAEAVVRGGRITALSFVPSPTAVQRRRAELSSLLGQAPTAHRAAPPGDGPDSPRSRPRRGAAPEPADRAWPLALGGLALVAAAVARRRRRVP